MNNGVLAPDTASGFNVATGNRLSMPQPLTPMIWGLSDVQLLLLIPTIVHWATSAVFELIDRTNLLQQYRLHASTEELQKNRVTRWDCFTNVVRCQFLQTLLGLALCWGNENDLAEENDLAVAIWTHRVQATFNTLLRMSYDAGMVYKSTNTTMTDNTGALPFSLGCPTFSMSKIEGAMGSLLYWYIMPVTQLALALVVADAWMYVLHRQVHRSKWLYKHVHSQHHQLCVPYSWGAAYGHIFDNIVVDGFAYTLACWVAKLPNRLAMILFAYSSFKNVVDHAGYVFPWDPIRMVTGTSCDFHDVHHQPWGLKTNFGLHFSFWDRLMGTLHADVETIARNRIKSRVVAEAREFGKIQPNCKQGDLFEETRQSKLE